MSTPTVNPTRQQLDELDALLQRMLSLPVSASEAEPLPPAPPAPPPAPLSHAAPASAPAQPYTNGSAVVMPPMPAPMPAAVPLARPQGPPRMGAPPPAPPRPAPLPPPAPPRRRTEVAPGDQSWNVPLPAGSGPSVSVFGSWPMGIDALATARVAPPPPASAPTPLPTGNLRVTTVPSPDEANHLRETPPPMERLRMEVPAEPAAVSEFADLANPPAPSRVVYEPVPAHLWPVAGLDWMLGTMLAQFGPAGRWLGQGSGKVLIGWCGLFMIAGAVAWGVMDYMGWRW